MKVLSVKDLVGVPGQEGRLPVIQHPDRIEVAEYYSLRAFRQAPGGRTRGLFVVRGQEELNEVFSATFS